MNKKILFAVLLGFILFSKAIRAQNNIVINTGLIDGIELNRQNILSYQIISNLNYSLNADVHGSLFYRSSDYRINYTYTIKINPGINQVDVNTANVNWTYSSSGLRELFQDYNKLPAGTYQYCIKVTPRNVAGEHDLGNITEECLYNKNEELFLINLIDPENDAKLYEKNPSLSWVANYSFSSDLTYKLRIAEIKKGQNTVTAISRNNPIYSENGLRQNMLVYPMSAKELQVNQPYAWTVDAFYKGILLGGAEPWKFTILEDSVKEFIPKIVDYVDARREKGDVKLWAIGVFKLKYVLEEYRFDELVFSLSDAKGRALKINPNTRKINYGDNRIDLDLTHVPGVRHLKTYELRIKNKKGNTYVLPFKYVNPNLSN